MGGNSYSKDHWKADSDYPRCIKCKKEFTMTRRRHHCRSCGGVFCSACCRRKATVPTRHIDVEVRVCDTCYFNIVAPSGSPSFQNPNHLVTNSFNNGAGGVGGAGGNQVPSYNRLPGTGGGDGGANGTGAGTAHHLAAAVALPPRQPVTSMREPSQNNRNDGLASVPSRAERVTRDVAYVDIQLAPDVNDLSYYDAEVEDFPGQLNLTAEDEDSAAIPPLPDSMFDWNTATSSSQGGEEGAVAAFLSIFAEESTMGGAAIGQGEDGTSGSGEAQQQQQGFRDLKLTAALDGAMHDVLEAGIPSKLAELSAMLVEDYEPKMPSS